MKILLLTAPLKTPLMYENIINHDSIEDPIEGILYI